MLSLGLAPVKLYDAAKVLLSLILLPPLTAHKLSRIKKNQHAIEVEYACLCGLLEQSERLIYITTMRYGLGSSPNTAQEGKT